MVVVQGQRRVHVPLAMLSAYLDDLERLPTYDERAATLAVVADQAETIRVAGRFGLLPYEADFHVRRLALGGFERELVKGPFAAGWCRLAVEPGRSYCRLVWEERWDLGPWRWLDAAARPYLAAVLDRGCELIKLEVELQLIAGMRQSAPAL